MDRFFTDYLDQLGDFHKDCKSAIAGLSQEALDWKPGPEMNSIAVLIVHIAGAERYWFGDFILGEPSGRDREGEFQISGLDAAQLTQRLDDAFAYIQNILEKMTIEDLPGVRVSPRDGREFTIGWALLHVLRHTALHLGHIDVTRHMWDLRIKH